MFEQTFLNDPQTARKPYSMLLSLMLQILAIGVLCLLPIVFTNVLPSLRLKDVLAAPPKPPVAVKARAMATRATAISRSAVFLNNLPLKTVQVPTRPAEVGPPPGVETGGDISQEGATDGVFGSMPIGVPEPPPIAAKPKPQAKPQGPIRFGGSVSRANLIHMVQPAYPPLALASRVQGTVEFTATISRDGTIKNLELTRGHPLLVKAAREAVLQWRYRPTLLNGEPVEVITDIVVNFTLNQQ